LNNSGHKISFIGYDWLTDGFNPINKDGIKVTKLKKRISIFFYLHFFISQLFDFLRIKTDIYFSADFYSLPAAVIAAKLKRAMVFYDSREIYTELPALLNRPVLKKIFRIFEQYFIKRVDAVFTTGEMDSEYIEKLFEIKRPYLLRNLPLFTDDLTPINYYRKYKIPETAKVILYQGIIVLGRGIETCFKALKKNNNLILVLLGGGEDYEHYKSLSQNMGINNRVIFAGKITQDELLNYTAGAFAGLSLIDDISINNKYALPNKLFEYVMSGVPVIASDLVQMKKIIKEYNIGEVITESDEDELIDVINKWESNPDYYNALKENCRIACRTLNWENEFSNVDHLFS
jgi:glycosyltransferase involved in cell wall biosynthesis